MKSGIAVVAGVILMAIVFFIHADNALAVFATLVGFILIVGGLVINTIEMTGGDENDYGE